MNHQLSGRSRRAVIAIALIAGLCAFDGSPGLSAPSSQAAYTPPSISHLNDPTQHYTIGSDGLIHAQIYNAPVGISNDPSKDTWHLRTPQLAPPSGTPAQVHASD